MTVIQKKKRFTIDKITYEIDFPNVGQYMDIENMRLGLTNGNYVEMMRSGLKSSYFNLQLVDAISVFYTLVPQLRKDLNVTNYNELDIFLSKKLVKVWDNDVRPWYDELMAKLMEDDDIPEPIKQKEKEQAEDVTDIEKE